jgi:8-oxo-dGTP diphosphatase
MAINSEPDIHNLVICANVFVIKGDKVLLLRRSLEKKFLPGYVQPIGGKVELNEDSLTAARRELLEETNLEVKHLQLKGIVTEIKTKKDELYQTNWQIFHFVAEYNGGNLASTEEGELVWLSRKELKQQKIADSIRFILDALLSPQKSVVFAHYVYGEKNTLLQKDIQFA